MPEGHVVHRLAIDQQELVGRRLEVTSPQGRFGDGAARLDGRVLAGVEAKGKHLFHHFDGGRHLHVHMGMQGRFLRDDTGRAPVPQARVRLAAGHLAWELVAPSTCEVIDDAGLAAALDRLGPDPLRPDADRDDALHRLAADGRPVGEVLIDQAVISGVGNVLRAEILWACGVHPRRPVGGLEDHERRCLWDGLVAMMRRAVDEGRILTVPARDGVDRATLAEADARFVYKQARCRRCGTEVQAEPVGGRTSYACPSCQPVPGADPALPAPDTAG